MDMRYIGKADKTALMSTVLPVIDKYFPFHLSSLCSMVYQGIPISFGQSPLF